MTPARPKRATQEKVVPDNPVILHYMEPGNRNASGSLAGRVPGMGVMGTRPALLGGGKGHAALPIATTAEVGQSPALVGSVQGNRTRQCSALRSTSFAAGAAVLARDTTRAVAPGTALLTASRTGGPRRPCTGDRPHEAKAHMFCPPPVPGCQLRPPGRVSARCLHG